GFFPGYPTGTRAPGVSPESRTRGLLFCAARRAATPDRDPEPFGEPPARVVDADPGQRRERHRVPARPELGAYSPLRFAGRAALQLVGLRQQREHRDAEPPGQLEHLLVRRRDPAADVERQHEPDERTAPLEVLRHEPLPALARRRVDLRLAVARQI